MKKINHSEMVHYLRAARAHNINMCLVSQIGVGKTEGIEEYARTEGMTLHTLILSALDASETLGVPVTEKTQINGVEVTVLGTALPKWAVDAASEKAPLIFLEELLTAPPEVLNTFLNFLTTKKVGPLDLSHAQVVFATNVENDGIGYSLPLNSLDRLCLFELTSTAEGTSEYLFKKLNGHGLRNTLISNDSDFGKGSILYQLRKLSNRNFEKLASLSKDDKYGDLIADFHSGMTNMTLDLKAMQSIHIDAFQNADGHPGIVNMADQAGLKSRTSRINVDKTLTVLAQNFLSVPLTTRTETLRAVKAQLRATSPRINLEDGVAEFALDAIVAAVGRVGGTAWTEPEAVVYK